MNYNPPFFHSDEYYNPKNPDFSEIDQKRKRKWKAKHAKQENSNENLLNIKNENVYLLDKNIQLLKRNQKISYCFISLMIIV